MHAKTSKPRLARSGQDPWIDSLSEAVRTWTGHTPMYGSGNTAARWRILMEHAAWDVVVGRLLEAHLDAEAILHEIGGGSEVEADHLWGVWAAEPPADPLLLHEPREGPPLLQGSKPWCSGAGLCTHALVSARRASSPDERVLCAVRMDEEHQGRIGVDPSTWKAAGMERSRTYTVSFQRVEPIWITSGKDYLERAGFWHGAIGVAACWLGGAEAVSRRLRKGGSRAPGPHRLAHLGEVDSAIACARWALESAARELDAAPDDLNEARIRALRLRLMIGKVCTEVIERSGRALGAAPLCLDAAHAQANADLSIYIRQSHAEVDAETLGSLRIEA